MRIDIQQLSKQYKGGHHALRDVDLAIGNGMFGLLGPNGAGKTTLIKILVTLLTPTAGEVRFDDLDLQRDRAKIRRLIGYLSPRIIRILQAAGFNGNISICFEGGDRNRCDSEECIRLAAHHLREVIADVYG